MGNNQNHEQESTVPLWVQGIEKEVQKLGYNVNVRSDRYHQTNLQKLYQIPRPERVEVITQSTSESLFTTELENIKGSRKTLDPYKEFYMTTLIQESDPQTKDFEIQVLKQLSNLEGCLLEIFQSFRRTQLPKNSHDQDTLLIQFRDSFVQILIYYYDLNSYVREVQCKFLNRLSLQCLVTNMIFNQDVSTLIYTTRKEEQLLINEQIHAKMTQAKDKTLADFGISIKYCLDCTTRDYIQSKQSKISSTPVIQYYEPEPVILEQVDSEKIPTRPSARLLQGTFFKNCPFESAIQALNIIQLRTTPHHKLKQLLICFQCIYAAIVDYYQQFAHQPSNMSTDEMITIFHYVLSKSKLQNPYTHFDIMKKYFGNLDGVEGLYLTIMESTFSIL